MKDRKKNVRRRPLLGENYPPAAPNTVSNQNRTLGNDAQTVKQVLVDSQNIQNHGTSKASSKRNVNMGVNRSNTKGEPVAMKPSRQRKKPGDSFFHIPLVTSILHYYFYFILVL